MDLTKLSALELGREIKNGQVSAVDAVKEQLAVIKDRDAKYQCFISVEAEKALAEAEMVQKKIEQGEYKNSPIAGVPIAVKDNICVKDMYATCASKMLYNFKPGYHAAVIEKLKEAGAIIIGKTNMDEFAMGSTTETSYFGETKNPWDIERVPGGSSGGSAAAVAAEETPIALGSDTGGSIRQPSAFCGVTGIKPTYGTVSRFGLIAYASSLDQIGPIGRNVSDCATLLEVIAGHDIKDSTSVPDLDKNYMLALVDDVKGMRIGIPSGYIGEGLDPEIREAVTKAGKVLAEKGAIVETFDLDMADYAVPAYYVIASAEASSNLSRYDGVKYGYRTKEFTNLAEVYKKTRNEGFGQEVKRRMMIGAFVLSSGYYDAYYIKALQVKALIKKAFDEAFKKYDFILGPTAPTTALKSGNNLENPLKMYLGDIYTVSVNLAGLPAISLPYGIDSKGLPIGLQLIGDAFKEKTIIRGAYALEQTRPAIRPAL